MADLRTQAHRLGTTIYSSAARGVWPELVILLLLPVVLIPINDTWTYLAPNGGIDAYIYTGFFRDLKGYLNLADFYQGSRLPWLLLGNAAYYVASPEVANLFLRLLLFYASVLTMFTIVYGLWRQRTAAFIAALVIALQPYLLTWIRSDYVAGPGIVAILLTLACLTLARTAKWPYGWLVAAGSAAMITLSVNLFLVVLLPAFTLWFLALHLRLNNWKETAYRAVAVAAGVGATFAVFALINHRLTGRFNYLAAQINASKTLETSVYRATDYTWVERAGWLVVPTLGFILSCGLLAFVAYRLLKDRRITQESGLLALVAGVASLVAATLLAFQLKQGPILQYQFYAVFYVPFAVMAVGGALSYGLKTTTRASALFAIGALALVALFVPLGSRDLRFGGDCISYCSVYTIQSILLVAASTLVLLGLVIARHPALAVLGVLLVSLVSMNAADNSFFVTSSSARMHNRFLLVYDIDDAIWPYNVGGSLYYWYDVSEPMGATYQAAASLRLWYGRLISQAFPTLKNPVLDKNNPVPVGSPIAVFSDKPTAVAEAIATFEAEGLQTHVLDRFSVRRGSEAVQVTMLLAEPRGKEVVLQADDFKPLSLSTEYGPGKWNGLYGPTGQFPTTATGNNYWVDPIVATQSGGSDCASGTVSLWPQNTTPPPSTALDPNGYEVGVRFKVDEPSVVCGLRFYGIPGNDGTHVGGLWSEDGASLARVNFANGTPEGWQTAYFTAPVKIDSAHAYVASYSAPLGHFAWEASYFTKGGIGAGPLHAPLSSNRVRTKPQAWAYAADYPLPEGLQTAVGSNPFYLHIRARARGSSVGLILLDKTQTVVLSQATVPGNDRFVDLFLTVTNPTETYGFVVRTMGNGQPGTLEVESITAIVVDAIKAS